VTLAFCGGENGKRELVVLFARKLSEMDDGDLEAIRGKFTDL
jgi:hypothetical protein